MLTLLPKYRSSWIFRAINGTVLAAFFVLTVLPSPAMAQGIFQLPPPGAMVALSPAFVPATIKGIKLHPDNPLRFDFIIDTGDSDLRDQALQDETNKLIKYFLASLTVPEDDLWVNLSPYEKDRIIPDEFGVTEMGRDLLSQDYLLKQITSSLIYPDSELGKKFWDRVYKKAKEKYGTIDIPVNTFNKVWVMPDKARIYKHDNAAFVVEAHLKVMLEEDYLAFSNQSAAVSPLKAESRELKADTSQIIRDLIIPELEKEVNEGKNFAQLRQVYNSLILATWFKRNLKENLLSKVYVGRNKVEGVDIEDKDAKQKIYDTYLEAYKKGVYNFIKEEYDPAAEEDIPRKYFSGGVHFAKTTEAIIDETGTAPEFHIDTNRAMMATADFKRSDAAPAKSPDRAMMGYQTARILVLTSLAMCGAACAVAPNRLVIPDYVQQTVKPVVPIPVPGGNIFLMGQLHSPAALVMDFGQRLRAGQLDNEFVDQFLEFIQPIITAYQGDISKIKTMLSDPSNAIKAIGLEFSPQDMDNIVNNIGLLKINLQTVLKSLGYSDDTVDQIALVLEGPVFYLYMNHDPVLQGIKLIGVEDAKSKSASIEQLMLITNKVSQLTSAAQDKGISGNAVKDWFLKVNEQLRFRSEALTEQEMSQLAGNLWVDKELSIQAKDIIAGIIAANKTVEDRDPLTAGNVVAAQKKFGGLLVLIGASHVPPLERSIEQVLQAGAPVRDRAMMSPELQSELELEDAILIGQHPVGEKDFSKKELEDLLADAAAKQPVLQNEQNVQAWRADLEDLMDEAGNPAAKTILNLPEMRESFQQLAAFLTGRGSGQKVKIRGKEYTVNIYLNVWMPGFATARGRTAGAFTVKHGGTMDIYFSDIAGLIHEVLEQVIFPSRAGSEMRKDHYHTLAFFAEGILRGEKRYNENYNQTVFVPQRAIAQLASWKSLPGGTKRLRKFAKAAARVEKEIEERKFNLETSFHSIYRDYANSMAQALKDHAFSEVDDLEEEAMLRESPDVPDTDRQTVVVEVGGQLREVLPKQLPDGARTVANISVASRRGERKDGQQDRFVTASVNLPGVANGTGQLAAVFDGFGGEDTAEDLKNNLQKVFEEALRNDTTGDVQEVLKVTVTRLQELTGENWSGSTGTITYLHGAVLDAAVVGDSPLFVKDKDGRVIKSVEHNTYNPAEVEAALARGAVLDEKKVYLQYPDGENLLLTRAFGSFFAQGVIGRTPDLYHFDLAPDSFVFLASDGITNMRDPEKAFDETGIRDAVEQGWTAQKIVDEALKKGSFDNVTAILLKPSFDRAMMADGSGERELKQVGTAIRRLAKEMRRERLSAEANTYVLGTLNDEGEKLLEEAQSLLPAIDRDKKSKILTQFMLDYVSLLLVWDLSANAMDESRLFEMINFFINSDESVPSGLRKAFLEALKKQAINYDSKTVEPILRSGMSVVVNPFTHFDEITELQTMFRANELSIDTYFDGDRFFIVLSLGKRDESSGFLSPFIGFFPRLSLGHTHSFITDPLEETISTMDNVRASLTLKENTVEHFILGFHDDGTTEMAIYNKSLKKWQIYDTPEQVKSHLEKFGVIKSQSPDRAMTGGAKDVGGIDFNPANLNIEAEGQNIQINVPPLDMKMFEGPGFKGLTPFIIQIVPVTNLPLLLGTGGMSPHPGSGKLVDNYEKTL